MDKHLKQTTLSKYKLESDAAQNEDTARIYQETEADKMMVDSLWSRVKNREQMENNDTQIYSYKKDYLDLQQANISKPAFDVEGATFIFDNEQVKRESHFYKTDEFKLDTD